VYPMKLIPPTKDYIWGGEKFKTEYNISTDASRLAEAWVLSVHPDGESVISDGEFSGRTLTEVLEKNKSFLGTNCSDKLPIMFKLIDAKKDLSIQVHPDDNYAKEHENDNGKTEAWFILDCDEDAEIIFGFNKNLSKEEFVKAIEEENLEAYANRVKVKKGDCFLIEAGTLHAICKGIVIGEVQQSSNVTYRVYDYGRTDDNGNKRELHIEKAIDVTRLEKCEKTSVGKKVSCRYFESEMIEISGEYKNISDEKSFVSLVCTDGIGELETENGTTEIKKGDSIFIPANMGEFKINGNLTVIETRV